MGKMSPLRWLFTAQFLSAFVDNMILFIVFAVIIRDGYPDYYLPFVQSVFLLSFILLSPWVGRHADKKPKARVLIIGNFIKLSGVLLLTFNLDPALSYALVGVGAVVYSPAKYGILPFLARSEEELLKANSGIESYTILAIVTGALAGGILADFSIMAALFMCMVLYVLSIAATKFIPLDSGNRSIEYKNAVREFWGDTRVLMKNPISHFALIGTSSFWMSSAVLRMLMFAWAPLVLGMTAAADISMIIAVVGVGIVIGAMVTPYLISMRTYYKTVWFGLFMAFSIFAFLKITSFSAAVVFLLLIGIFGGIYIVPMNACLQQVGHNTIGTGKTIAIQNFLENTFMFAGVSAYALASKQGVSVYASLTAAGVCMLGFVAYLFLYYYWSCRGRRLMN
jgi:LPLT family lysophospholipid transporter-like MFS transporter